MNLRVFNNKFNLMRVISFTVFSIFLFCGKMFSQQNMNLSLEEVISLAKNQSPVTKAAKTNFTARYWQYKLYKSNYLPQLGLNGTLPDYNRSISAIVQDNGSNLYVKQGLVTTSLRTTLSQNIGFTGGNIYMA